MDLGSQDDVVTTAGQGLADNLLRFAGRVHVRGINEVDAGVQGAVDDPDRVRVIGVAPRPEHHGPETELAHLDPGQSQVAVPHRIVPSVCVAPPKSTLSFRSLSSWR